MKAIRERVEELRTQAIARIQAGGYSEGAELAQQCLALAPDDGSALECLAVCQIESQQLAAARQTLERLLQVQPENAIARDALSKVQLALNSPPDSTARSLDHSPEEPASPCGKVRLTLPVEGEALSTLPGGKASRVMSPKMSAPVRVCTVCSEGG